MMKPVTYLYMKEHKYYVGTAENFIEALRVSKENGAVDAYIFNGDVEDVIRKIGVKKAYGLVKIVQKYNMGYENTMK